MSNKKIDAKRTPVTLYFDKADFEQFSTQCVGNLAWSHIRLIMRLDSEAERRYCLEETGGQNRSMFKTRLKKKGGRLTVQDSNLDFNPVEFDWIRMRAVLNSLTVTFKRWNEATVAEIEEEGV